LSALSWGAADFSGGFASRRLPALTVVFWSQLIGVLFATVFAGVRGESSLPPGDVIWAVLAGLSGPTALVFFYRGLAVGRMSVVAPIAGVLGAGIPVLVGGILEGLPAPAQLAGIALALVSVLLVTRAHDPTSGGRRGVYLAITAGLGFGAFFVFLGRVSPGTVFAPLVVARVVATLLIAGVVVTTRVQWRVPRPSILLVAIAGTLDMGGNLWYLLAAQQGRLDVAAVLASLYPVVTVLLAASVLRERVAPLQRAGIALTLTGVVLISF
jgi:drug/metabolite transporter (DMT)-like permease